MKQEVVFSEVECTHHIDAVEDALYVLGGRWKIRVMIAVLGGHTRFNDLQRTIKGISARVLSNELKQLEINGLVKRVVEADQFPVVVAYIPTEYATTLKDVVGALADWGHRHKKQIINEAGLK